MSGEGKTITNCNVTALEELLIDFTPSGLGAQGNPILEQNSGGILCNVLAMLVKCGRQVGFIGRIGNDIHGRFLKDAIMEAGIGLDGLVMSDEVHTTPAFVSIDGSGDRSFPFYHSLGADMALRLDEVNLDIIRRFRVSRSGILSMVHDKVCRVTKKAVECVKASGCMISFDPNLRPPLWEDMEEARRQTTYEVPVCDILKIEDKELSFMTQTEDEGEGVRRLQDTYGIPFILVTTGVEGSRAYWAGNPLKAEAFLMGRTVDTTGAGNMFYEYCLDYLLDHPLGSLTMDKVGGMPAGASGAAPIITTRKGALCSMLEPVEVEAAVKQRTVTRG